MGFFLHDCVAIMVTETANTAAAALGLARALTRRALAATVAALEGKEVDQTKGTCGVL